MLQVYMYTHGAQMVGAAAWAVTAEVGAASRWRGPSVSSDADFPIPFNINNNIFPKQK